MRSECSFLTTCIGLLTVPPCHTFTLHKASFPIYFSFPIRRRRSLNYFGQIDIFFNCILDKRSLSDTVTDKCPLSNKNRIIRLRLLWTTLAFQCSNKITSVSSNQLITPFGVRVRLLHNSNMT